MQACEGPPGLLSNCPFKRKGFQVSLRQGDLNLCDDCNEKHFQNTGTSNAKSFSGANVSGGNNISAEDDQDLSKRKSSSKNTVQQSDSDNCCKEKEGVILHPLLTYIAASMQSGNIHSISRAVKGYFTLPQIINAKYVLWKNCSTAVIGEKICRRGSTMRPEIDATLQDIIEV